MVCRGGRQVGQATEPRIVALQLRSCYACRRAARNGLTGKGGRLWLCPSSRLELFPGLFRLLVSLDCAHDFLFGLLLPSQPTIFTNFVGSSSLYCLKKVSIWFLVNWGSRDTSSTPA